MTTLTRFAEHLFTPAMVLTLIWFVLFVGFMFLTAMVESWWGVRVRRAGRRRRVSQWPEARR